MMIEPMLSFHSLHLGTLGKENFKFKTNNYSLLYIRVKQYDGEASLQSTTQIV